MASVDLDTLQQTNQYLSKATRALDAYIAGTANASSAAVDEFAGIAAHALLFVHLVQVHSGAQTIDEMTQLPISKWADVIKDLKGVTART